MNTALSEITLDQCVARMKRKLDRTLKWSEEGREEVVSLTLEVKVQSIGPRSGDLIRSTTATIWTPEKGLTPRIEVK